jgi:hypothetical protein
MTKCPQSPKGIHKESKIYKGMCYYCGEKLKRSDKSSTKAR